MASPSRLTLTKAFRTVIFVDPLYRILAPHQNQTLETWREDAARRIISTKRALGSF